MAAVVSTSSSPNNNNNNNNNVAAFINFQVISSAYCTLTLTDGALRTAILLNAASLGFTPIEIAVMFMLYELLGIIINLFGGGMASTLGLKLTCLLGLSLQGISLILASLVDSFFPIRRDSDINFAADRKKYMIYIAIVQALAGAAKDFLKVSGKSVTKLVSKKNARGKLFRLVSYITGAKNAIKGVGMFLGGLILSTVGYLIGLIALAILIIVPIPFVMYYVDPKLGMSRKQIKFLEMFKTTKSVGMLSLARFWLYGSRDLWFEIAAPIFLSQALGWNPAIVSGMMGAYTVVYGKLQAASNALCLGPLRCTPPRPSHVLPWTVILGIISIFGGIAFYACHGNSPSTNLTKGSESTLCVSIVTPFFFVFFAIAMAVVSAVHSFLIVAYAGRDKIAKEVGFYYMSNAGGRLIGTLLSGVIYEYTSNAWGLSICLWVAAGFLGISSVVSFFLPPIISNQNTDENDTTNNTTRSCKNDIENNNWNGTKDEEEDGKRIEVEMK